MHLLERAESRIDLGLAGDDLRLQLLFAAVVALEQEWVGGEVAQQMGQRPVEGIAGLFQSREVDVFLERLKSEIGENADRQRERADDEDELLPEFEFAEEFGHGSG